MRIGVFSEAVEPVQNGVSVSVRTLVEELRRMEHNVVVVAPHYPNYRDDSPHVLRVPSALTPFNPDYPVSYPWFPKLRRKFSRLQPDVLHSHNPFFLGLLARHIAKDSSIPHVSTYHTLLNHYAHYVVFLPEQATQTLLKWWLPEFYNKCRRVIAPSRVAKQSLLSYGVEAPIEIVPTAVPLPHPDSLRPAATGSARETLGVPPAAPLLLYVGRLAKEKNIELLLDAFAKIGEEHRSAWLAICGGGPHMDDLMQQVAVHPFGDRIRLPGPIERTQLDSVYASADLFVFPSDTETQGLVIAEARAAGTPSVVVRGGGAGENVRDGIDGRIVSSDAHDFARAVSEILSDRELRKRMSDACRAAAPNYSPSAMAKAVENVYQLAIEDARASAEGPKSRLFSGLVGR
jgi:glycosyltransferase involved in cell wall biosynthesis